MSCFCLPTKAGTCCLSPSSSGNSAVGSASGLIILRSCVRSSLATFGPLFHVWIRTSANPLHQSRLKILGPEGHSSQNPAHLIHRDPKIVLPQGVQAVSTASAVLRRAAIAQLGECQTEDLKVPGSIPGLGMAFSWCQHMLSSCVLSFSSHLA